MKLPKRVELIDVGPRDGFQNIGDFIPTATKLAVIGRLVKSGIRSVEITSFVNPKAVAQMADAAEVAVEVLKSHPDLRAIALVPNLRGANNAYSCGIRELSCVISASESHNMANINRKIEQSLDELSKIREALPDCKLRLTIATAFGCPFEGVVTPRQVESLARQGVDIGADEIILCDTIGIANPLQVASLTAELKSVLPAIPTGVHFHNTRGMGLANTLAAMQEGVCIIETSAGGLGGCPFAPGASGNTSTEDTVNMLECMGVETGVSLPALLEAVKYIRENIPGKLSSAMYSATIFEN